MSRLTLEETLEINGIDLENEDDLYQLMDSIVPACCDHGCMVEPDGHCPHGHPSVILELGLM